MDPAWWDEHGKRVRQLKTNPLWPQCVTFPKEMAGHEGMNKDTDGKHGGLPDSWAGGGGSLVKREVRQVGEAVPKRIFAVVAEKQGCDLAPCAVAGWPGAW